MITFLPSRSSGFIDEGSMTRRAQFDAMVSLRDQPHGHPAVLILITKPACISCHFKINGKPFSAMDRDLAYLPCGAADIATTRWMMRRQPFPGPNRGAEPGCIRTTPMIIRPASGSQGRAIRLRSAWGSPGPRSISTAVTATLPLSSVQDDFTRDVAISQILIRCVCCLPFSMAVVVRKL